MNITNNAATESGDGEKRRDFLVLATAAVGLAGTGLAMWPFIDSMNPSADVLALASTEIDLAPIQEGQRITAIWRGKPVFINHRTPRQIAQTRAEDSAALPDPQADSDRVQSDAWLIVVGICTHLGCIPLGQGANDPRGDYGGWFCPCHGSHYDTSGRIRKGPAPRNLDVPPYAFTEDTKVLIG